MAGETDLILDGVIVSLDPLPSPERKARWRVTVAIDRVTRGDFDGDRFEFVVHSPARSGLVQGGDVTVRAEQTSQGYRVDPDQWLPRG